MIVKAATKLILTKLDRRVQRLHEELDENIPDMVITEELRLIKKAVDELLEIYDLEKVEE